MLRFWFLSLFQLVLITLGSSDLSAQNLKYKLLSQSTQGKLVVSVYKNMAYSKTEMEIVLKVICDDGAKKSRREFYLKKANASLRAKVLSNFVLTEELKSGTLLYPFGWETENITQKEMKENCISIIKDNIQPIEN